MGGSVRRIGIPIASVPDTLSIEVRLQYLGIG